VCASPSAPKGCASYFSNLCYMLSLSFPLSLSLARSQICCQLTDCLSCVVKFTINSRTVLDYFSLGRVCVCRTTHTSDIKKSCFGTSSGSSGTYRGYQFYGIGFEFHIFRMLNQRSSGCGCSLSSSSLLPSLGELNFCFLLAPLSSQSAAAAAVDVVAVIVCLFLSSK
jgi:hypothetical protein